MARIRSIKPEFWQDYRMAQELTRDVRLLYIGLWNEADDEGRFLAHPRRLLGIVFPYDRDITEAWMGDALQILADTGRLVLYEVDGEPYGELTKFEKHQKINKPSSSKIPSPTTPSAVVTERSGRTTGNGTDVSPRAREEQGAGSRELEREGEVERDSSGGGDAADSMRADELLKLWIDTQPTRPPSASVSKQGAAAKRICDQNKREDIDKAVRGMGLIFPHSAGEPWDLFDLERKFAKAYAAQPPSPAPSYGDETKRDRERAREYAKRAIEQEREDVADLTKKAADNARRAREWYDQQDAETREEIELAAAQMAKKMGFGSKPNVREGRAALLAAVTERMKADELHGAA